MLFGRLAQLVEHPLDVREVTGSSPVSSTKERHDLFVSFFFSSTTRSRGRVFAAPGLSLWVRPEGDLGIGSDHPPDFFPSLVFFFPYKFYTHMPLCICVVMR